MVEFFRYLGQPAAASFGLRFPRVPLSPAVYDVQHVVPDHCRDGGPLLGRHDPQSPVGLVVHADADVLQFFRCHYFSESLISLQEFTCFPFPLATWLLWFPGSSQHFCRWRLFSVGGTSTLVGNLIGLAVYDAVAEGVRLEQEASGKSLGSAAARSVMLVLTTSQR